MAITVYPKELVHVFIVFISQVILKKKWSNEQIQIQNIFTSPGEELTNHDLYYLNTVQSSLHMGHSSIILQFSVCSSFLSSISVSLHLLFLLQRELLSTESRHGMLCMINKGACTNNHFHHVIQYSLFCLLNVFHNSQHPKLPKHVCFD